MLPLLLLACGAPDLGPYPVDEGQYWLVVPEGLDPEGADLYVHLHHSGDGEGMAQDAELAAAFAALGQIVVYPDGGGEPGDDWNVGINKDDIPRDDTLFLEAVAEDLRSRWGAATLWLGGTSKGGAMSYEMACLGAPVYEGYVPLSGAIEAPLPHACTNAAAPLRHLQGTQDDRWPLWWADDPESSHMGIMESLGELAASDDTCLQETPVEEGDCQVWSGCPEPLRLCWYEGGHAAPSDWPARQVEGIAAIRQTR
ncbi:MAG: hypothetical protein H6741_23050 [Alphaproteobacteria bacterium]|nr:hypothetical protein [Alphaproteobacteria bacterium]